MAAYIDLSEKHGHRDDHGFACGAEFNVKIRRRIDIPDFVREQLSESEIDSVWWEEAGQVRDSLKDTLQRRYKWIGELAFVGRGPGWLAIEDTGCGSRNWDTIGKVVDQHLKNFIKSMESPRFWRDIKGVTQEESPARHHAAKKSPAQLQREIDEALARPTARHHSTAFDPHEAAQHVLRPTARFSTLASGETFRFPGTQIIHTKLSGAWYRDGSSGHRFKTGAATAVVPVGERAHSTKKVAGFAVPATRQPGYQIVSVPILKGPRSLGPSGLDSPRERNESVVFSTRAEAEAYLPSVKRFAADFGREAVIKEVW